MESSSPKEISDKIIKFSGINIFKNNEDGGPNEISIKSLVN